MKKISVIVPAYNEEESIPLFYKEISKVADEMGNDFEFIFVNDGSKDKTLQQLKSLALKDNRVKYISFSRNFGKEAAILAGLKLSSGDLVTVMDADLQHPPKLLPTMYDAIVNEGFDVANTRRTSRKGEPKLRSWFARKFYKLINSISKVEMVDGACDYRLMTRQVVDSVLELTEYNRYSKGIFSFVGYDIKWIPMKNTERVAGTTKWSFKSLISYAIEGIVGYSTSPLSISTFFGFAFLLTFFVLFLIILINNWIIGNPTNMYVAIGCMLSLVAGIQLICLGILGKYLAKTYTEVKKRPIYIIKETNIKK